MKKFSKLFLSCAAVAAVTAAVATSAMAAGGISATYTAAGENATAKLTIDASGYTADQKTLLIVPSSVSLDKVTADDVVQIDQNAEIVDVALPAKLKDGSYTVYMGGDGEIHETTFHVGAGEKILVGDANQDTLHMIDGTDAVLVLKHSVADPGDADYLTGAKFQAAAQCNALNDTIADGIDATVILKYSVDSEDSDLATTGVGKTITVDVSNN